MNLPAKCRHVRRIQWIVAFAAAACTSTEPRGVPVPGAAQASSGAFIASVWHAGAGPKSSGPAASTAPDTKGVVFLSLPPGSIPFASEVTVRARIAGESANTTATDGGFDPLSIVATAGDTLDVVVRMSDGSTPVGYTVPVPKQGRPVVIRTSPAAGKRDVPLNADVVVVFSDPISATTVNGTSIQLADGSTIVRGELAFADSSHLVTTLVPSTPLAPLTQYTITISTDIENDDGQSLAQPFVASFTTADITAQTSIDQIGFAGFGGTLILDLAHRMTLSATAKDSSGTVLTGRAVVWSSSDPSVATVSTSGDVTGVAAGRASISATIDGESAARTVQVVPGSRALVPFELTLAVTDSVGAPRPGARVEAYYRGKNVVQCPYGCTDGVATGFTKGDGTFSVAFLADPDGYDRAAGAGFPDRYLASFSYIEVHQPFYETDRRFVQGGGAYVTQAVRLQAITQLAAGDSAVVSVASTDPVCQQLDTTPADDATFVCQSLLVRAITDGVIGATAVPVRPSDPAPYVELANADDDVCLSCATQIPTVSVHAGDLIEVRVATKLKPGDKPMAFVVHTSQTGSP